MEQDANIVLMLHTKDTEQKFGDGDTRGRFIDLFVRKNRDGKLGHINYEYFGDYIDFKEKIYNKELGRFEDVYNNDFITNDDLPF